MLPLFLRWARRGFLLLLLSPAAGLAQPAATTRLDPSFLPQEIYQPSAVMQAVQLGDGSRVLAGSFIRAEGQNQPGLVRYLPSGQPDAVFNANVRGYAWSPFRVAEQAGGKLIVVLNGPATIGGQTRYDVVRLNADGTLDAAFAAQPQPSPGANRFTDVLVQPDGKVVLAGTLRQVGGQSAAGVARLNADGTLDAAFRTQVAANGGFTSGASTSVFPLVTALARQPDGKLLVGGSFGTVQGQTRLHVARLLATGGLDAAFAVSNVNPAAEIGALAVQPDGQILIGTFNLTNLLTSSSSRLVRVSASGAPDASFSPSTTPGFTDVVPNFNGGGGSLLVQPDGKVLALLNGGSSSGPYLTVRLLATGSRDPAWNGVPYYGGELGGGRSQQLLPTGQVLLAGSPRRYTSAFADLPTGVAVLSGANGAYVPGFAPVVQQPGSVLALALQPDGKLVIGGSLSEINGTAVRNLARLNANGTLDAAFAANCPAVGVGYPNRLALQPDGKVLVAGGFAQVGGVARPGLARLLPSGQVDAAFAPPIQPASAVDNPNEATELALQPNGDVLLAGYLRLANAPFTTAHFVRLQGATGQLDPGFQPPSNSITALAAEPNGGSVAAWQSANGTGQVQRLLPSGAPDPSFAAPAITQTGGPSGYVEGLLPYPDGRLLVYGSFAGSGAVASPNVLRLLANGQLDGSFASGLPRSGATRAASVALQPNGRILVGGYLQLATATQPALYLARLLANGANDASFVRSQGPDGPAFALAVQPDGALVVGGYFDTVGSVRQLSLARLLDPHVLRVGNQQVAARTAAWPVPAHDVLHLSLDAQSQPRQVQLLDALGRSVRTQAVSQPELSVNTAALPAGVYLLRVDYAQGGPVTRRVVVE